MVHSWKFKGCVKYSCMVCLVIGGLLITPWFMIAGTEKYLEMERNVDDYVKGPCFMYEPYYSDKDCCTGGDVCWNSGRTRVCTDCCPSVCKTLHMYANSTICEDNSKELHWDDGVCKETDSFLIWYKGWNSNCWVNCDGSKVKLESPNEKNSNLLRVAYVFAFLNPVTNAFIAYCDKGSVGHFIFSTDFIFWVVTTYHFYMGLLLINCVFLVKKDCTWVGVWYYTEFLAWLILIPIQMYAKARINHRHEFDKMMRHLRYGIYLAFILMLFGFMGAIIGAGDIWDKEKECFELNFCDDHSRIYFVSMWVLTLFYIVYSLYKTKIFDDLSDLDDTIRAFRNACLAPTNNDIEEIEVNYV